MKTIAVSYKQLYEIISALELKLKLSLAEANDRSILTEDEIADMSNDIAFLEVILADLKSTFERWQTLPSTRD
ncbi:hypothetical protein SAMN05216350_101794 [Polaromonas sp. YR568]|uniref:hypothetical protein n=1 Tax=Polaromonas sp. YR568 TaxID=1855301 RepID=UPI0008E360E5|nr:hypothetical protein [Polaromonas sp. YR568]SFU40734.1 hypothetical protein SAMN05216350_101794 [Polaromonas sp. YR568]